MQIGRLHVDIRIVGGIVAVLLLAGLLLWPGSRPQDEVLRFHVDPQYNPIQRSLLTAKTRKPQNAWGRSGLIPYNPRSISLKSDGPKFDAYVLDLAGLDVDSIDYFLEASRRLEAGEKLEESPTLFRRLDATEASFDLATFPFGSRATYMVILYGEDAAEITGVVSYGGGAAK